MSQRTTRLRTALLIFLAVLAVAAAGYLSFYLSREDALDDLRDEADSRLALLTTALFAPADKYSYLPEVLAVHPTLEDLLRRKNDPAQTNKANRLLEQLNRTDTLTGLANRAHWLETAAREMQRYLRNQRPAALVLLDIDGFKQVNVRHGHAAGDVLLRELADVLRGSLRSTDTPGRLGGDEFGIVLPETGLEHAREVAERIRQRVERIGHIDDTLVQPCTLSLGVAEVGPRHANVEAWIKQADIALYLAKTQGRNRVCANLPEIVAH